MKSEACVELLPLICGGFMKISVLIWILIWRIFSVGKQILVKKSCSAAPPVAKLQKVPLKIKGNICALKCVKTTRPLFARVYDALHDDALHDDVLTKERSGALDTLTH